MPPLFIRRCVLSVALALLVLYGCTTQIQSTPSAQPPAAPENVPYPEQWQAFLADWSETKQMFLDHIAGAQNITIPINEKEFDWKVDWAAQQKYCKRIAQIIFEQPQHMEMPLPDVIPARDGIAATYAAIGKAFPKCTKLERNTKQFPPPPDYYFPTRERILGEQYNWRPERWAKKIKGEGYVEKAYFIGDDYFIPYSFNRDPENTPPLFTFWTAANHPHPINGCPDGGGKEGLSGDPTAAVGTGRRFRPTIFLKIDNYPVPVQFGVYSYVGTDYEITPRPASKPSVFRWGRTGQRYLVVKSLQHDLWGDWARSPLPAGFGDEDENHTRTGLYSDCVINFDSPTPPPPHPSTPLHSLEK
jgi:hypothetical protein